MVKIIFLDRDGVLNELREDYVKTPEELKVLPGVKEALGLLKEKGYQIIVISNQSAVGRGIITESILRTINDKLNYELDNMIDDFFYCPHKPDDGCGCRKPGTKMLIDASVKYDTDLKDKWVIGDNSSDILLGKNAGCRTILVRTGHGEKVISNGEVEPDKIFKDLLEAVNWLIG